MKEKIGNCNKIKMSLQKRKTNKRQIKVVKILQRKLKNDYQKPQ